MGETVNTTTNIAGVESATVIFSAEPPRMTISYSPPEIGTIESNESYRIAELEEQLGRSALELNAYQERVRELEEQVSYLETGVSSAPEPDQLETRPHLVEVPLLGSGGRDETSRAQDESSSGNKEESDSTPDPELSPAHQRYELALLFLLKQPGLSLKHPNAGGFLREALDMNKQDFANMKLYFLGQNIWSQVKSGPRRSSEICLNAETLLSHVGKPYVTSRVLKGLMESEQTSAPDEPTQQTQLHAVGDNGQNGARRQISPRVRKLLDRPIDGPVYRDSGKGAQRSQQEPQPFLGHRRETRGATRR